MSKALKIGVLTLALLLYVQVVLAAPILAIILDDKDSVTIVRKDGETLPCKKHEILYEGDKLFGPGVTGVPIKWYLNAKGDFFGDSEMVVSIVAPPLMERIKQEVSSFLGITDAERVAVNMVTRGPSEFNDEQDLLLQPGAFATLIPGQPAMFSWGTHKGKTIIVKSAAGEVIFCRKVGGLGKIELTPEEINMKPMLVYKWYVDGVAGSFKIMIPDKNIVSQVVSDLGEFDRERIPENQKMLNKAAYLQLLSDMYPDKIDFYWLSNRMLRNIQEGSEGETGTRINYLLFRCKRHLEEQM
ncbi:MAG: hypothetical protein Q8912_14185 [Bacillota bacterium]|nr:hypothetical protein [Bacillota bacterium]